MNTFLPTVEKLPEGHPVRIYFEESALIQSILSELSEVNPQEDFQKYFNLFNQLTTIEKRFARKENQLFPYLEKHGWNGPSQGMWTFHDNLRAQIKSINTLNKDKNIEEIIASLPFLIEEIERLLSIEDMRLFPKAMDLLTKEDWEDFYEGDKEIGWMLDKTPAPYPVVSDEYVHPGMDTKVREHNYDNENTFHYDEGYMTPEQVNLLLRFLPADITYVDEHDKVIFYNRGDDRVFPRSKGIIGREVKFCHPPKSVHMVIRIVEEFRAGTKDVAEFWFNFKGRFIHVRYFAIRDNDKKYKGVIEMSQDITELRKLEGEQRLLDWD